MNYFTDVYRKRVNRFGNNIQDRIKGQMVHDFEDKLKNSVNSVSVYDKNLDSPVGEGIVSSKVVDQDKLVYYFMTRVFDEYANGEVIWLKKPFDELELQRWMVFFKEQYETIGYNRYQIILLDSELEWVDNDGVLRKTYAHYVGERDKVKEQFKINNDVVLNIPSQTLQLVIPSTDKLTRTTKFQIDNSTWKVNAYDDISVPGVMYVTLEEDYTQDEHSVADKLSLWSINSEQGREVIINGQQGSVKFYGSYNGIMSTEEISVSCNGADIIITPLGNNEFTIEGPQGQYELVCSLKNNAAVEQKMPLHIVAEQTGWIALSGSHTLKVLQTLEYKLASNLVNANISIESENGYFVVDSIHNDKVFLTGKNIGSDNVLINYNNTTYRIPIKIISSWM